MPAGATLASGEVFRVLPLKSCDRDEDRNGHMENPPWRKVLSLLSLHRGRRLLHRGRLTIGLESGLYRCSTNPDCLLQHTGCEKFTDTTFVVTQDRLKNVLVIAAYDGRGPRD